MPATDSPQSPPQAEGPVTAPSLLLRLTWMLLGNAVLFLCGGFILLRQGGGLGTADLVLGLCIPVLLLVRYVDIRFFEGRTADNEPATMAHWRAYAWWLVLAALAFWGVAHLIGYTGWLGR